MIPEISASKVAGLIGLHKYQNQDEIQYELLKRDPSGKQKITEIETAENRVPLSKVLNTVLKEPNIRSCVSSGIQQCKFSENVPHILANVEQQAATILSLRFKEYDTTTRAWLSSEIRGSVSKRRGLDNEDHILNNYEEQHEVKVTERNTKTIRKDYGLFKLVGRTDGYVESENRIVDSKDRTRVWKTVPIYDEIQLRCYMNMTGASESELIERFPDKTTRVTKFYNDPEQWSIIQQQIENTVINLQEALKTPEILKRIIYANTVRINNVNTPNPNLAI